MKAFLRAAWKVRYSADAKASLWVEHLVNLWVGMMAV